MKSMRLHPWYLAMTAALIGICVANAQPLNQRILVVYNSQSQASLAVANYYMSKRSIPAENLCAIAPRDPSGLTLAEYYSTVRDPIRACLNGAKGSQILYIVMSYFTPYDLSTSGYVYAIDSFLADLWDQYTTQVFSPVPTAVHDYYADTQSQGNVYQPFTSLEAWRAQPGAKLLYSVWRLDGATQSIAQGLVDSALAAEAAGGPSGTACFDARTDASAGIPDYGYYQGEWELYRASTFLRAAGFPTVLDTNGAEFGTPPAPNCPGAAFYSGWYSLNNYNDAFTWNTGAIGFHLDSFSAGNPRGGANWSANALIKGITTTAGAVWEPFLEGLPRPGGLYRNLLEGANVGDAFIRNTRWLKWTIINIGDPLYRPFPGGHAPFNPPAPEASLALSSMQVVGGHNVTGTVSLAAAAPAGGTTVTLTSNVASAATVPASVQVIAGSRTATFPVTTSTVTDENGVIVTIGANTGSGNLANTLTVYPLLGGLQLSQSTVNGGQAVTGTVFLNDPAPSGGVTLSLSSSNPAATVPQSVTVPAGQSQMDFQIATSPVGSDTLVTISAAYAGATTTASLTVSGTGAPPTSTITTTPVGLTLTVDSAACTSPCMVQWMPGSNHTIAVTASTQAGTTGTQYVFANWSDGGAQSHSIVAPSAAATYTANFTTKYFLTTASNPAAGGAIAPASGWYSSGAVVAVSATANNGYQFAGFTGALTGTTTPQNLTLTAPASVTATFSNIAGSGWYGGGTWPNRRKITIDHTKVLGGGSLVAFPVLVSITDAELKSLGNGGKVGRSDGTDIAFTDVDGVSKLSHELESYNGSSGSVVAWVRIPTLATAVDTSIYLYYGNASAADQQNKVGVWDGNYKLVNHFKDSSGTLFDSTQFGNNGTPSGGAAFTPAGAMGGAYSFDGASGSVTIPYSATWNGSFNNYTVQMWIKMGTVQDFAGAIAIGGWGSSFNMWFYSNGMGDLRMDTAGGGCDLWPAQVPLDNAFHQLVLSYDAGISTMTNYVDGAVASYPRTCTGPLAMPVGNLSVGGFSGSRYLQSTIDELRISANATRSAAWIATEYNNQKSPGSFYIVGATETSGAASTITIASAPGGLSLTVDGSACTAPCAFQWTAGSNHTIAVTSSPQAGAPGTQYVFANWSDGGTQSHMISAPSAATTYTANFTTQYFLTTAASPAAGGTIAPGSGWYASGAVVAVSATANSGYQFSGFTGAVNGTTTPQNLTMTAASTVTANFTVPSSAVTITSAPSGLSLAVDGSACTAPCAFQWTVGSNHTIAVTASTQAGPTGTQYVFASWSDGGAQSHTISAPSVATTYTANFTTQYFLTTAASPVAGGAIAPGSGWYTSGAVVAVSATANNGYQFTGFTGAVNGTTTPQNLTMTAASTVTANFTVPSSAVTITSAPSGLSLAVDGSACTAPCAFQWTVGSNHTIAVTSSPQGGAPGTQYVFASWSDGGAQSHTISAPSAATTYTANFNTQYFLTTAASPAAGGTIAPGSGWYASGTVVGVSATANSGYQFSGFTGALSGTTTPQNLTMTAASTVTANFTPSGGTNWYNPAWANRRKLTINHARVSGSLANFPMLVSITDPELKPVSSGGKVGKSDGTDIVFTAGDGTSKLNHELESYNAATGNVVAWVQIPSMNNVADSAAYLYYGNASAADQQNKVGVWDSNYKVVNHFKDPSGTLFDSTQYGNNGTPSGGAVFAAAGAMGGAYSFDGATGLVTIPYSATWNGSFSNYTVQMWIKMGTVQDFAGAIAIGGWGSSFNMWFYSNGMGDLRMDTAGGGCDQWPAQVPLDNAFHQLVLSYDAGISVMTDYVDGVVASYPRTCTGPLAMPVGDLSVGGFSTYKHLQGVIDELRISANATRSAGWIATEYNNQKSPGTFYSVGGTESFH
jgi:uncharacterized protein (TIGR03790 family)